MASNGDLIVGWVSRFDSQKRFGFAEANLPGSKERIRVFFHLDGARIVDVSNYPQFVLTDQKDPEVYPTGYGRNPTRLVMQLRYGNRGWRAVTWGVRPGQTWVYDFLSADTASQEHSLARFVGGDLKVTTAGKLSTAGTITALQLLPLRLQVTVNDVVYEYDLTSAYQRFADGDVIITLFNAADQEVSLRFHK